MVFCTGFWVGGGLESRCVGRVYGADVAVRCRKPYSATQRLMLVMMGVMYPKHVDLRIH